jgi:hypothetical protein
MEVRLMIVPEEGEEFEHSLVFDMPGVPQAGDCVTVSRPGQAGSTKFIVRRAQWTLDYPDAGPHHRADAHIVGTTDAVTLECEYAVSPYSAEEHKRSAICGPE